MAETELQQFVRDTIISVSAFGLDPFAGLIKIAEHVGIPVQRDDEGHAYLTPADRIWIGDTVRLTGAEWGSIGLANVTVTITDIDVDGDPQFVVGNSTYTIYSEPNRDFTATKEQP